MRAGQCGQTGGLRRAAARGRIIDGHMTRKTHHIRQRYLITEYAIVPDMGIGHQEAIVANHCCPSTLCASPRHCDTLSKDGPIPDVESARLSRVFIVSTYLWFAADNCE